MNFSILWRFESIRLAAMEQIDEMGYIDEDKLFDRAKKIYDAGFKNKIENWNSIWEGSEDEKAFSKGKIKKPKKIEQSNKKTKVCPKCEEEVPSTWKKHKYMNDGTACGHEFN